MTKRTVRKTAPDRKGTDDFTRAYDAITKLHEEGDRKKIQGASGYMEALLARRQMDRFPGLVDAALEVEALGADPVAVLEDHLEKLTRLKGGPRHENHSHR